MRPELRLSNLIPPDLVTEQVTEAGGTLIYMPGPQPRAALVRDARRHRSAFIAATSVLFQICPVAGSAWNCVSPLGALSAQHPIVSNGSSRNASERDCSGCGHAGQHVSKCWFVISVSLSAGGPRPTWPGG